MPPCPSYRATFKSDQGEPGALAREDIQRFEARLMVRDGECR
jgi:hypothetical protein